MALTGKVHGTAGLMVLLTAIAGWVDAVAYVRSGSVFVANQTGNAVFLAVQVAERWVPGAQPTGRIPVSSDTYGPISSLLGFCVGVAVSVPPLRRSRRRKDTDGDGDGGGDGDGDGGGEAPWTLLAIEALLLASVVLLPATARGPRLSVAAAAMGVQSVYAAGVAMRGVSTTTLTGTLVTLISAFAEEPGRRARRGVVLLSMVWAAYTVGAWGGAAAGMAWSVGAVHGVAAVVAGVVAVAVWVEGRGRRGVGGG